MLATGATGTPCFDAEYFPFGADNLKLNNCPQAYHYATYERDPETGLDYAILRYYNSRLGRFMSPDLLAGGVDDPQSLNRYAYVLNDPINLIDPLGLDPPERPRANQTPHYELMDARTLMLGLRDTNSTCILNGITTSCGTVYNLASMGQGSGGHVLIGVQSCPGGMVDGGCHNWQTEYFVFYMPWDGLRPIRAGGLPRMVEATIKADPGAKEQYCKERSNFAAAEEVLPGLGKAIYGDYREVGASVTKEAAVSVALKTASKTSILFTIRSWTGVPMSVTAKALSWAGYLFAAGTSYSAMKAAQREYKACMEE